MVKNFTARLNSTSTLYQRDWATSGLCYQGSLDQKSYMGCLLFPTLRDSVEWDTVEIQKITLTLTFGDAGYDTEKVLNIHQGLKNEFTGPGSEMLGTFVGKVTTNGTAYNSTRDIIFDATRTADAFSRLLSWLQNTDSLTLVLYDGPSEGSTASENYLVITEATLTIEGAFGNVYVYQAGTGFVNALPYAYINSRWVRCFAIGYASGSDDQTSTAICGDAICGFTICGGGRRTN